MTSGAATAGYLAHQWAAGAHLPRPISAASCTPQGRMTEVVIIEVCVRTDARSWGGREKEAQGRGGSCHSGSARVPGDTWRTGQQGKGSIKAPWGSPWSRGSLHGHAGLRSPRASVRPGPSVLR